jgi:flagellar motor switch protein FliG
MERFFKGKCALAEYADMKSETHIKSELPKAISISTAKLKSGQAEEIFSSLKKEMSLYEANVL